MLSRIDLSKLQPTRWSLIQAALLVIIAVLAGSTAIAVFTADRVLVLAILGLVMLTLALVISGNPRLFMLWGLVLTAPIRFGKDFVVLNAHMGGAASFSIELVDVFMAPLIYFILRDLKRNYRKDLRFSRAAFFWCGMIFLGVLTLVFGPYRTSAAQEALQMGKNFLVFLVIINEVVRVKQFKQVFYALMLGVLLQSSIGIMQFLAGTDLGLQVFGEATLEDVLDNAIGTYENQEAVFRIGALIGHPNLLVAYLAILLPIGIAQLFSKISTINKSWITFTLALGGAALVLTLSRMGWIAFAVAFVVLLCLTMYHPKIGPRMLVVCIPPMLLLGLAGSGPIVKRLTRSDSGAVDFRYEWMGVAWNIVKDNPVLGVGLNSFVFIQAPYTRYGGPTSMTEKFGENWPVVHNIYLLIWSEQGTIGLFLFMGLYVYLLLIGIRNLKYPEQEFLFLLNCGCICGILALMIDGMGSFFIRLPHCGRLFWIVAGLILAIHYWHQANSVDNLSARPDTRSPSEPSLQGSS